MGFIDRETESKKLLQIRLEQIQGCPEEAKAKKKAQEEEPRNFSNLLESLPKINFKDYLKLVSTYTDHDNLVVAYMNSDYWDQIREGIGALKLTPAYKYPTDRRYCGDTPFKVISSNDPSDRRLEPNEPGIGIRFSKLLDETHSSQAFRGGYTAITAFAYSRVYVRLVAPATAFVTSYRMQRVIPSATDFSAVPWIQKVEVTDLKALDDAMEKAFEVPVRYTVTEEKHIYDHREYRPFGMNPTW